MPAIDPTTNKPVQTPPPPPPKPPAPPAASTQTATTATPSGAPAPASATAATASATAVTAAANPDKPSAPSSASPLGLDTIGKDVSNAASSVWHAITGMFGSSSAAPSGSAPAQINPGDQPPSYNGVPPQGTQSTIFNQPTLTAQPQGTLFSKGADPQAADVFEKTTSGGVMNQGIQNFINGNVTHTPYFENLPQSEQDHYNAMTQAQRTQVAMQQLGATGVTKYLGELQMQQSGEYSEHVNPVQDPKAAQSEFQSGFNQLVANGQITTDDVKALATAPIGIMRTINADNQELGFSQADMSGNAKLIAGLGTDVNDPKATAVQNEFAGASYDTADALLAGNDKDKTPLANLLYASGTQALAATPYANQSMFLYGASPDRIENIVNRSLQGEASANSDMLGQNGKGAAPFNGTTSLFQTLSGDGWSDDGRLPMDSKQQQDIVAAYKGVQQALGTGSAASFDDLRKLDQDGSGTRLALSNLYDAGMPAILNDSFKTGGRAQVATDFGRFSEYELGGDYASKGEGQLIGRNLGNTQAEFYDDLTHASTDASFDPQFFAKYGTAMFPAGVSANPSNNTPAGQTQNEIDRGWDLFGAMMHGASQGYADLAARSDQSKGTDPVAASAFAGALGTAAGAGIILFAPEATPLVALGNTLLAGGAAGTLYSTILGLHPDDKTPKPPANLDWNSTAISENPDFASSPFGNVLKDLLSNNVIQQQEVNSFNSGWTLGS